jgi:hypothetical protein
MTMMRKQLYKLVVLFLSLLIVYCNNNRGTKPADSKEPSLEEKRLGSSDLYITIPNNYSIEEDKGIDFTVYSIEPKSKKENDIGAAGIYLGGHPKLFGPDRGPCIMDRRNGKLFNNDVSWSIYNCKDRWVGETILMMDAYEKVHAFVTTTSYQHADSLIRMFESLREKRP